MFRTWKVKENCEKRLKRSKKTLGKGCEELLLLCGVQRREGRGWRPQPAAHGNLAPAASSCSLHGMLGGRVQRQPLSLASQSTAEYRFCFRAVLALVDSSALILSMRDPLRGCVVQLCYKKSVL